MVEPTATLTPEEDKCLKLVIKALKSAAIHVEPKPLDQNDIVWLMDRAMGIFMKQPMLVETTPPISICGDVHGQFCDLLRLLDQNGWPPKTRYLFLGDYVDRGPHNLETICLMFAIKIRFPDDVFILRGNHETRSINRVYGFYDEIHRRYYPELYEQFNNVFDWMPLAALVSGRIMCMHGGISPDLMSLDQIREVQRPLADIPAVGIVADLLWADPDPNITGYASSSRGISYLFGPDVVVDFCDRLDLDLVARAHQVVQEGYEFFADGRLVTVFSAGLLRPVYELGWNPVRGGRLQLQDQANSLPNDESSGEDMTRGSATLVIVNGNRL